MPAVYNATAERQEANKYPNIRIFTVGHATQSPTPLRDLQTVWEPWQVASNETIEKDFSPGHTLFSTFSAVCWLFGKKLSDELSSGNSTVPLGLISNNWGGTKVEVWSPKKALARCGHNSSDVADGPMYNAMILPYAEGPMALSGFLWYQGEANTANLSTAIDYACTFPSMITAWREAFAAPDAFFSFVQLSTWCAQPPESLPQVSLGARAKCNRMRRRQYNRNVFRMRHSLRSFPTSPTPALEKDAPSPDGRPRARQRRICDER